MIDKVITPRISRIKNWRENGHFKMAKKILWWAVLNLPRDFEHLSCFKYFIEADFRFSVDF